MHPGRLRVRRWDDEAVVYDDRSGNTHLLDDRSARILERLLAGSAGLAELAALDAGAGPERGSRERREAAVEDVLSRLAREGIAKPLRK